MRLPNLFYAQSVFSFREHDLGLSSAVSTEATATSYTLFRFIQSLSVFVLFDDNLVL